VKPDGAVRGGVGVEGAGLWGVTETAGASDELPTELIAATLTS
jgi:hypothetical protein